MNPSTRKTSLKQGVAGRLSVLYENTYLVEESLLKTTFIDSLSSFCPTTKIKNPPPKSKTETIRMGLAGATGRVGEKRGNGLCTVAKWLRQYYQGEMRIQSNSGIVSVVKGKTKDLIDKPILGTEVYLRLQL